MDNTHLSPTHVLSCIPPRGRLYFVGILGVSMTGLAHLAVSRGYRVAGCDRAYTAAEADVLRQSGIPVEAEDAADPRDADMVVYTLAVSETSPAIVRARAAQIPLVSRATLLAALTHTYRYRIAIAGMHGKSTTVGMLAAILQHAHLDPTVLSGAPLTPRGDAHRIGGGDICLMEACEYRNSYLALHPTLGVVTNIELDHPDFFPDMASVEDSFSRFLWNCDAAVVGGDCPALHAIASPDALRFGMGEHCELRGTTETDEMHVTLGGTPLGALPLAVTGEYNRKNALAATAAALHLGIPFPLIREALFSFRGVGRRMEYAGRLTCGTGHAEVYLDYAHHPTELTACITTARERGRVIAVFQPHTYSRTRALWEAFVAVLSLADYMVVTDIYAAREMPICGTTSSALAGEAGVDYATDLKEAAGRLLARVRPGDTVLILGAGDIVRITSYLPLK